MPAALMEAGPRAASREVGRLVEAFGRANVARGAVGPRGPARHGAQRRAGASRRRVGGRRGGHQQRALRHAGRLPAGHHAGRRAGAPAPGRAGGLAAPRPRRPACAPAPSRRRRFARWPGVVERAGELGPGLRLRPAPGGATPARLPRPRGDGRAGLPAPAGDRGGHGALRATARPSGCRAPGSRSSTSSR